MSRSAKTFVSTDFSLFERENDAHFEVMHAEHPGRAFELGEALRAHAVATQPGWPTAEDREQDLEDHLRFLELVDRVNRNR